MNKLFLIESLDNEEHKKQINLAVGESITIGKIGDLRPVIKHPNLSRIHCTVKRLEDRFSVEHRVDLPEWDVVDGNDEKPSTHGIFRSGELVDGCSLIKEHNDRINLLSIQKPRYELYLIVIDKMIDEVDSAYKTSNDQLVQEIQQNRSAIDKVATLNIAQNAKLSKLENFAESAKTGADFLIWVSDFGKPLVKGSVILICAVLPLIVITGFGKYWILDNGAKTISEWVMKNLGKNPAL